MKILHFYKTSILSSVGGVETFIDDLCNATADLGIENTVLSLADKPQTRPVCLAKYQIIQAKQNLFVASTGFSISAFAQFKRLAQQVDIVHYHFPNPFADLLHFLCQIENPRLLTYHADIVKQKYLAKLYEPLMYKFLGTMGRIIATSPNYFATSNALQKFRSKVKVIPVGINKEAYPTVSEAKMLYWQTRIKSPFFLFVGAFRYYKGLYFALDAVKGTNIQLVLAGTGGIEQELKAYATKHRLDNVHFVGLVSDEDKVALLQLCYGFLFPSHLRSEAFGISLLEAAAYGKPLISCEIGTGTSFINQDQHTGLVIKPASSNALRQAMYYLLENPEKAAAFGKNAEKHYERHFTLPEAAEAYLKVYKKLLKRKPSRYAYTPNAR